MIYIIAIALAGVGIGASISVLVFLRTRPAPAIATYSKALHTFLIVLNISLIPIHSAHLGEPQACWLVAEMLGVAIDACQP